MKLELSSGSYNIHEYGQLDSPHKLIFLHYFGGSGRSWHEVITALPSNFYCLALDLGGFGESSEPKSGYSFDNYVYSLIELLAKLNIERYTLVGHSMGGKLALLLAAHQPEKINQLVLVAPSPPTSEPMDEAERARLLNSPRNRVNAIASIQKSSQRNISKLVMEQAIEDNLRVAPQAWQWWLEQGSRDDISDTIVGLDLPTVVIAGSEDANMTSALLEREVVRRIKGARLDVIQNAGHLLPLEAPAELVTIIQAAI